VLDVSHLGTGGVITADFLRQHKEALRSADYALLYTGWEKKWATEAFLSEPFPVLDEDAAHYLVTCGLKGVGTDAISVDPLDTETYPAHHALLSGGLVIVENLCLKKVLGRTDVMFFALPLKYANADGAPVRAIAEFRDFPEKEMTEA
jgi:kynurenine formamidase